MRKLCICSASSNISGAAPTTRSSTSARRSRAIWPGSGLSPRPRQYPIGRDRPAEATRCYERALAIAPGSVARYNLGNTCHELGQLERAIACFERALRLRPDAIELHNNLGTALQDFGRLDEAIACYRRALALRPGAVETLDNLGGALRAQGQLEAARACYERGSRWSPIALRAISGSASSCATKAGRRTQHSITNAR